MLTAFGLALSQLGDPAIRRVLAKSLALTLTLFALFGVGVWWGVDALLSEWAWHGGAAAVAAAAVTVLALWLLFRAVAIAVIGVFADEVVQAVEARHYPDALASARPVPLARSLGMGLASAGRFVVANLLALPIYLALLATGVGTAALFLLLNGWLLGRDLGDMVAVRHLSRAATRDWRKATGGRRFALGLVVTGLFVVPLVNLVAPVLGAAAATQMFHRGRR